MIQRASPLARNAAAQLAEAGLLGLGELGSHRIKLEEINDGTALLTRSEGTRIVIL